MPLESTNVISGLDSTSPRPEDPTNEGDDHLTLIKRVLKNNFPGIDGFGFKIPITSSEDQLNYLNTTTGNIQVQLDAITGRLDVLESNLTAPSGTVIVFYNSTVPLGWTKLSASATYNDFMFKVVTDASGGQSFLNLGHSPVLNNLIGSHTHVGEASVSSQAHNHTFNDITTTNNVGHTHTVLIDSQNSGSHSHVMMEGGITNYAINYANPTENIKIDASGTTNNLRRVPYATQSVGNHTHNIVGDTGGQDVNHTHIVSGTTSGMSANGSHGHAIEIESNAGGSDWAPKYLTVILGSKD